MNSRYALLDLDDSVMHEDAARHVKWHRHMAEEFVKALLEEAMTKPDFDLEAGMAMVKEGLDRLVRTAEYAAIAAQILSLEARYGNIVQEAKTS